MTNDFFISALIDTFINGYYVVMALIILYIVGNASANNVNFTNRFIKGEKESFGTMFYQSIISFLTLGIAEAYCAGINNSAGWGLLSFLFWLIFTVPIIIVLIIALYKMCFVDSFFSLEFRAKPLKYILRFFFKAIAIAFLTVTMFVFENACREIFIKSGIFNIQHVVADALWDKIVFVFMPALSLASAYMQISNISDNINPRKPDQEKHKLNSDNNTTINPLSLFNQYIVAGISKEEYVEKFCSLREDVRIIEITNDYIRIEIADYSNLSIEEKQEFSEQYRKVLKSISGSVQVIPATQYELVKTSHCICVSKKATL